MKVVHIVIHLLIATFIGIFFHKMFDDGRIQNTFHWLFNRKVERQNVVSTNKKEGGKNDERTSSVWCWGNDHVHRICLFNNLYFHSNLNEFLFVHGSNSVYHDLPENLFDPALLDLSSVHDHNAHYFNYVDVFHEKADELLVDMEFVPNLTLMLHRFYPDNLMHVFHDDLLPIFHTLNIFLPLLQSSLEEVQLFFLDNRSLGEHEYLYEIFSSLKPLYRSSVISKTICFSRVLVGITKNTAWYQYGFLRPQGPLSNILVSGHTIKKFANFVRKKLNADSDVEIKKGFAVLLVRKQNRLLLNEVELVFGLVHDLGLKVEVMSYETNSLAQIISVVSKSEVLIGMHGSILILSLFLPPGALLVELFPYAINPNNYTPYKTLVSIPDMRISYASWRNFDVKKTRTHPERAAHEGGIKHLTKQDQKKLLVSSEVLPHLCCQDPAWLFRIYQDTEVNVKQVVKLIKDDRQSFFNDHTLLDSHSNGRYPLMPFRITSIQCKWTKVINTDGLVISWKPPINLESLAYEELEYELWLQEIGSNSIFTFKLSFNAHTFTADDGIESLKSFYVWVRCILDNKIVGPFNSIRTTCRTVNGSKAFFNL